MELTEFLSRLQVYAGLPLKFLLEAKAYGIRAALSKVHHVLFRRAYRYVETFDPEAIPGEVAAFSATPRISIIMPVYNTPVRWLSLAVDSVRAQLYPHWELCIADDHSTDAKTREYLRSLTDSRIRIRFLDHNRGIAEASNEAIAMASGEYVTFLDHDDELTRDALFEVAKLIDRERPDVIYSDEDMISGRKYIHHFKSDFSPDLLLSHNYITHLLVVKKSLLDQVGRFRPGFDGAQDYDLLLRLTEQANVLCHIRKVLYHWRRHRASSSLRAAAKPYSVTAGKAALEDALRRRGIAGQVEPANLPNFFRVRRALQGRPLVSIIIPFRDQPDLLETCVASILTKSSYENFQVLGINNGSREARTRSTMAALEARDARVEFHDYDIPFNYSRINNHAVSLARGEHLILLNNDIELITPDWIEALLEHSQRPEVGAVGGKLYYADDKIQHAGVIVGIAGFAGHSHRHKRRYTNGYFNRIQVIQNLSAVTGAMLMVKKDLYVQAGGLDEVHLGTALNDVDFCLRLREFGYLNVFTPYAEAYHYESVSRGYETTPEKQLRFDEEIAYFRHRHEAVLKAGDPYYNPNLSLRYEDFRFAGSEDSAAMEGAIVSPTEPYGICRPRTPQMTSPAIPVP